MGLVDEARSGQRFLFLGYKGSGKSALGEHLRLLSNSDPHLFVHLINIADISFSTFSQISKGVIEPEARYPSLAPPFLLDSSADYYPNDADLFLAIKALKSEGLLPQPGLKELIHTSADSSFSLKLSTIIGSIEASVKKGNVPADFPFLVAHLKLLSMRLGVIVSTCWSSTALTSCSDASLLPNRLMFSVKSCPLRPSLTAREISADSSLRPLGTFREIR